MSNRKTFLLRISPELYAALEAWAHQEMRSVNSQIEYLLKEAVLRRQRGRDIAMSSSGALDQSQDAVSPTPSPLGREQFSPGSTESSSVGEAGPMNPDQSPKAPSRQNSLEQMENDSPRV